MAPAASRKPSGPEPEMVQLRRNLTRLKRQADTAGVRLVSLHLHLAILELDEFLSRQAV